MAPLRLGRCCVPIAALLLLGHLAGVWAQAPQGSPSVGRDLFTGGIRLQNGGPACASCHSIASIPFPNGGTMGPDLTRSYTKFGPDGMAAILETLFFPTMVPVFNTRALTSTEQLHLAAFFRTVASSPPPSGLTLQLGAIALVVFLVLFVLTWLVGRRRVLSVRRSLLERSRIGGRRAP